ncbi:TetR/AcrR family transcriptional regulator [Clostridium intestinale]|uniref:Transcriptional regulator, TetR family n=1 Tax=Clostridium intestinale DSM 6191 TaxID=1121320 RepID=A0A1M5YLP6_9CLOT|nr:TetR/AcrR family transcriptional regulator [Clostridium intestinale]SHI12890.1 transcriptional regulator, TetR family [Clostridium intestinale DSM 6191]
MYHIKNDKRSIQTSKFIYNALSSLLEEKKYEDIKITEVIERSQVSRATFYRNYDSLDDILRYELDQKFIKLSEYLYANYKSNKNTNKIHPLSLLKPFLRFWYLDSLILEQLLATNKKEIIIDNILRTTKNLLEKSNIEYKENIFYDYMLNIRSNIIFSVLETWVLNDKNLSPDELYKLTIDHLNESLTARINVNMD